MNFILSRLKAFIKEIIIVKVRVTTIQKDIGTPSKVIIKKPMAEKKEKRKIKKKIC